MGDYQDTFYEIQNEVEELLKYFDEINDCFDNLEPGNVVEGRKFLFKLLEMNDLLCKFGEKSHNFMKTIGVSDEVTISVKHKFIENGIKVVSLLELMKNQEEILTFDFMVDLAEYYCEHFCELRKVLDLTLNYIRISFEDYRNSMDNGDSM